VPALTAAQAAFLRDNPYYAVFTTLRADGSPHTTVVWVEVGDDGTVSVNTPRSSAKRRHVANDPRVSLTVLDPADGYHWVGVSGNGQVVDEGAEAQIDRLAKKYLGEDTYPWHNEAEPRVTVRITPTRIEARGFDD